MGFCFISFYLGAPKLDVKFLDVEGEYLQNQKIKFHLVLKNRGYFSNFFRVNFSLKALNKTFPYPVVVALLKPKQEQKIGYDVKIPSTNVQVNGIFVAEVKARKIFGGTWVKKDEKTFKITIPFIPRIKLVKKKKTLLRKTQPKTQPVTEVKKKPSFTVQLKNLTIPEKMICSSTSTVRYEIINTSEKEEEISVQLTILTPEGKEKNLNQKLTLLPGTTEQSFDLYLSNEESTGEYFITFSVLDSNSKVLVSDSGVFSAIRLPLYQPK